NGAGKTTTVRILATLVRPDVGAATVAGFDILRERREVRRRISLTGQNVAIDELQTGAENLEMMGRLAGLTGRRSRLRAREMLECFELVDAAGRTVATYSGGMRRRLDLACGLVGRPSVLFLDEPTTGLDLHSRQAMWELIAEQVRSGVGIVLTTQYLEEADQLADSIVVIDAGRVVASGTPAELKRAVADQRLDVLLRDDADHRRAVEMLGDRAIASDRVLRSVSVPTDGSAAAIRRMLDEIDPDGRSITKFSVHTATLDDVFLALTGHSTSGSISTGSIGTGSVGTAPAAEPVHV
ncbi:ATP-binding cassette domain-containing protein, partial [Nakamurella sp. GG22]